jgi:hypothetical protein
MKILLLLTAAAACAAAPRLAAAADPVSPPLQLKPKALLAPASAPAPFSAAPVEDRPLDLAPRSSSRSSSPSACGVDSNLCWDPSDGRIVYKPARRFMPTFPGLTPENVSLRRDRVVFRYSF